MTASRSVSDGQCSAAFFFSYGGPGLTRQGTRGGIRGRLVGVETGGQHLVLQLSIRGRVAEQVVEDGADGDGRGVGAGEEGNHHVAHDGEVVDDVGVGRLGVDEMLKEIRDGRIESLVLALQPSAQRPPGDHGYAVEIRRADALDGVLVEEKIEEGHLADGGEAGDQENRF